MIKINGALFGHEEFHNGEVIYKNVPLQESENTVELKFEDNRDIANLVFAVQYIRDKSPEAKLYLNMLYIPYSRMDREIQEGNQIFSMKYFADIINSLKFDKVRVLDPHSDVSFNALNNCEELDLNCYVREVVRRFSPDYIMFPDKGAYAKYPSILNGLGIPFFHANKKRDWANKGALIEDAYELVDAPELNGKSVLIVDDIVSLGGTAYLTGKTLKKHGVIRVALYVSHAENGVFYGKLLNGDENGFKAVDLVYTAATTPLEKTHDNLIVVEV